jgi:hypothetical protein
LAEILAEALDRSSGTVRKMFYIRKKSGGPFDQIVEKNNKSSTLNNCHTNTNM